MIYDIKCNGNSIFTGINLMSPRLSLTVNEAGSLEFTANNSVTAVSTSFKDDTYEVREFVDNTILWRGRPSEVSEAYDNNYTVYCEGALAYFNDSVVLPVATMGTELATIVIDGLMYAEASDMLQYVVNSHNRQVDTNRQLKVGQVTVAGETWYRWNYEKSMDALSTLRSERGGYMLLTYDETDTYINWLSELPTNSDQSAAIGINILDFTHTVTSGDVPTVYIPLGKTITRVRETDTTTKLDDAVVAYTDHTHDTVMGEKLTLTNIRDVNSGSDEISTGMVSELGRVVTTVDFSDITNADELLTRARAYVASRVLSNVLTDVDVADLHYEKDHKSVPAIRYGTNIRVVALSHTPTGLDTYLPCMSMDIELDSAVKRVTLGTVGDTELRELSITKAVTSNTASQTLKNASTDTKTDTLDSRVSTLENASAGASGDVDNGAWVVRATEYEYYPSDDYEDGLYTGMFKVAPDGSFTTSQVFINKVLVQVPTFAVPNLKENLNAIPMTVLCRVITTVTIESKQADFTTYSNVALTIPKHKETDVDINKTGGTRLQPLVQCGLLSSSNWFKRNITTGIDTNMYWFNAQSVQFTPDDTLSIIRNIK